MSLYQYNTSISNGKLHFVFGTQMSFQFFIPCKSAKSQKCFCIKYKVQYVFLYFLKIKLLKRCKQSKLYHIAHLPSLYLPPHRISYTLYFFHYTVLFHLYFFFLFRSYRILEILQCFFALFTAFLKNYPYPSR